MARVGLYTLGCKVSQYETEAVAEAFAARGFEVCDFDSANDIYIINTCTVTAESDRKSRQMIRRARKHSPDAGIVVLGCYSQRAPQELLAIDGVFAVIGTENKLSAVGLAEEYLAALAEGRVPRRGIYVTDVTVARFEPMCITRAPRTRAYVKIEDGCESKCTYCAISAARGRVRSKPPEDAISEIRALAESGVAEIVLTGIETASYGRDLDTGYGLASLLSDIDALGLPTRIRLGSLAPELITHDLIDKMSHLSSLVPHFHLSIQSGSDSVLRRMKRRYNRRMLLDTVAYIKQRLPRATFTTDLMVGFPGETEEEFCDTLSIVSEIGLLDAHVFAYSRRAGTPAATFSDQVPENEKRMRSERLMKEKDISRERVLLDIVSHKETLAVIAETLLPSGYYTSHSDTYVEVCFPSNGDEDLVGKLLYVSPVSYKDGIIYAERTN